MNQRRAKLTCDSPTNMSRNQFDSSGCVAAGTVTPTLVTHDYWGLTQYLSGTVAFVPTDHALYDNTLSFNTLVQFNGTAQVEGISAHGDTSDQMLVPLVSHWQPNGESGHTEIRGAQTHWPTGRAIDDVATTPFLPIGQVNGMEYTPERLLLPPRYSEAGNSSSFPSMGGIDVDKL